RRAPPPDDTVGRDHHDRDARGDVDHAVDPGDDMAALGMQDVRKRYERRGADDRAPYRADPAEHRDDQRLRRHEHAEHGRRRDDQQHYGVEAADRPGHRAAQRDRFQLP